MCRLKRKSPPSPAEYTKPRNVDSPADLIGALAIAAQSDVSSSTAGDPQPQQPSDDDYEKGIVVCGTCGEGVPFRDSSSGGFTLRLWDTHRAQW